MVSLASEEGRENSRGSGRPPAPKTCFRRAVASGRARDVQSSASMAAYSGKIALLIMMLEEKVIFLSFFLTLSSRNHSRARLWPVP